jgi:protein SCO1
MRRNFFALLALVLTAGIGALAAETEGFRVVTSDGARQLAVERAPVPIPDVRLVDQDGRAFTLGDYRGRAVLIEFIYTRCPTLCAVLGDDFRRVLALAPATADDLLSISFDPENDDRAAREAYAARYNAAAPGWRIAAPIDRAGLETLLKSFGVVVIPDGMGGFVHNGAVYLMDGRRRLVRILDPDAAPSALDAALRMAER